MRHINCTYSRKVVINGKTKKFCIQKSLTRTRRKIEKKTPVFFFADTRSTMSEHAKDMAIEITPKTETPPVRLPRIVAEINRVASRVRERKKKEERRRR